MMHSGSRSQTDPGAGLASAGGSARSGSELAPATFELELRRLSDELGEARRWMMQIWFRGRPCRCARRHCSVAAAETDALIEASFRRQ
eukprot:2137280-Pyramimonas_sp.AAC.1